MKHKYILNTVIPCIQHHSSTIYHSTCFIAAKHTVTFLLKALMQNGYKEDVFRLEEGCIVLNIDTFHKDPSS